MSNAKMYSVPLHVVDKKGNKLSATTIKEMVADRETAEALSPTDNVPAEITKRHIERAVDLDYQQTFIAILSQPAERASLVSEMRKIVPVVEKIEAAKLGGEVLLSKEEHELLKNRVENYPYKVNSRNILDMSDAVANAPEVEVAAVAPKRTRK